ncbi:MAG: ATP-binding protein [Hyphomicrobiaceae bacterium]
MPQLSIRLRLNLLIGTLLLLALAANVAVITWSAGPRIRAEDNSIVRLSKQTVERALVELQTSSDPARDLAALLDRMTGVRHARINLEPPANGALRPTPRLVGTRSGVPPWFATFLYATPTVERVPAIYKGALLGTIVIASNPGDEIAEIWEAVVGTLTGGFALITAVFALTSLAVRQALMPMQNLGSALRLMQGGDYKVALEKTGPPELAEISGKLNDLAATLGRTRDDNARLTEQIISLEDHERRELARELHDEFGPYLFAVRANLTSLMTDAAADPSAAAVARAKKCSAALEQISALQQLNRRVLQRLRPPALDELGLDGALRGLIANWRENNPEMGINLVNGIAALGLDQTTELTVYRVVQEGLTNVFRHAHASHVSIAIHAASVDRIVVRVSDNGTGLAGGVRPGFGLSGMRDRVRALGGVISMTNNPTGGFTLSVELPHSAQSEASKPATRGFVAEPAGSAHVSGNAVASDRS